MKKEIMEKWVKALRSGEYHQTTKLLSARVNMDKCESNRYHYCCLGVLCEIAANEGIVCVHIQYDGNLKAYGTKKLKYYKCSYLPEEVMRWAEIKEEYGYIKSLDNFLTSLNDVERKSFNEIADIIEKYYEEL